MLARAVEAAGISTVSLALVKEHAQRTRPPRALFVPFPYGYALGKADDPEFQHRVLAAALDLLKASAAPVLAEFPEAGDAPARLIQASAAPSRVSPDADPAGELTAMRGYYQRWLEDHNGRTAVGNTGIPQQRFRGLVRFLQAFVAGEQDDSPERPPDVPVGHFVRQIADDLKAFMLEARMAQRPQDRDNVLAEWFWADTAIGALVARAAARLKELGDERSAFGVAR